MQSLRFKAIDNLSTNQEKAVKGSAKITAIFGENVFTLKLPASF
jgi:glutamine synthetase